MTLSNAFFFVNEITVAFFLPFAFVLGHEEPLQVAVTVAPAGTPVTWSLENLVTFADAPYR